MEPKWGEFKGRKILVTGEAEFIGSNLVDRLSLDNSIIVPADLSATQVLIKEPGC